MYVCVCVCVCVCVYTAEFLHLAKDEDQNEKSLICEL